MLGRREVVAGGALSLIWAAEGCCGAHAQGLPIFLGCAVPPEHAGRVFRYASETRLFVSGNEPMIAHSGDREFDFSLAQTLGRLSRLFEVLPGFAYFNDGRSKNAYATTAVRGEGQDGTVLFGQNMLSYLLRQPEHPDVAVAAVCAHEFGHILQFKHGLHRSLILNGRVRPAELQADFFAGYFAGVRKRERPNFPAAVFATTKHSLGDSMLDNPDHHGTPDERAAAIVLGFQIGHREARGLPQAIEAAEAYARRL
ncbi:ImmA/IrrE family metallo-endopeptidase [Falsiroseomonas sp. E2-1-a4]|uniref:ImmA/IrrE family metallo-endopeptidase n=1 Tax=Falsiroseomonas sp. E2-1-a4 TaxID=3239299 RepID=UPI003F36B847